MSVGLKILGIALISPFVMGIAIVFLGVIVNSIIGAGDVFIRKQYFTEKAFMFYTLSFILISAVLYLLGV